ncbi:hypothetical protein SEA_PUPPER_231 [Gordonia phage Pupper]|uniref:Uncharacterized protein n=1 Tax=Gordonia phage Pupper TaxID=2571249 RepID=A0A4Y6EKZ5_9CAUD|nr:hypothetical protein KHQ83_gp046 [Gordonia phage Pupper]QDF18717.1 hypothetical protein SEA_PUPPER_231 [Gordonia phage Pupper]
MWGWLTRRREPAHETRTTTERIIDQLDRERQERTGFDLADMMEFAQELANDFEYVKRLPCRWCDVTTNTASMMAAHLVSYHEGIVAQRLREQRDAELEEELSGPDHRVQIPKPVEPELITETCSHCGEVMRAPHLQTMSSLLLYHAKMCTKDPASPRYIGDRS